MKPPAFQFYAKDWLADTRELGPYGRGVLVDLIALCWDNGSVPDDATTVAAAVGADVRVLLKPQFDGVTLWQRIREKFTTREDAPGRLFNRRLEVERAGQDAYRANQSRKGVASAAAKAARKAALDNHGSTAVETTVEARLQPEPQPQVNSASASASSAGSSNRRVEKLLSAAPTPPHGRFDFDAVYARYPRRKGDPGKKRGLELCRRQIKTEADYQRLLSAVERYAKLRAADVGTEFIPMFSTWMGTWTDFDGPQATAAPSKRRDEDPFAAVRADLERRNSPPRPPSEPTPIGGVMAEVFSAVKGA